MTKWYQNRQVGQLYLTVTWIGTICQTVTSNKNTWKTTWIILLRQKFFKPYMKEPFSWVLSLVSWLLLIFQMNFFWLNKGPNLIFSWGIHVSFWSRKEKHCDFINFHEKCCNSSLGNCRKIKIMTFPVWSKWSGSTWWLQIKFFIYISSKKIIQFPVDNCYLKGGILVKAFYKISYSKKDVRFNETLKIYLS